MAQGWHGGARSIGDSTFKRSLLSWFQCPHCGLMTYSATSRTILSQRHPRIIVEYQCKRCSRLSRLRLAILTHLGIPTAIGLCMVYIAYKLPFQTAPWYSRSAMSVLAMLMVGEVVVTLVFARLTKRFDKCV